MRLIQLTNSKKFKTQCCKRAWSSSTCRTKKEKLNINQLIPSKYRKIPIISPGLIFIQKAFLLGLFSGSLFSEGLVIGRNFAFQNGLGSTKNSLKHKDNSLKQLKTANPNSPWAYTWGGGGGYYRKDIFVSEIWGVYFRRGLLSEFYGIQ